MAVRIGVGGRDAPLRLRCEASLWEASVDEVLPVCASVGVEWGAVWRQSGGAVRGGVVVCGASERSTGLACGKSTLCQELGWVDPAAEPGWTSKLGSSEGGFMLAAFWEA